MALTNEATITLAVNVQNMAGLRALTTGLMGLKTQLMALQRSPAIRSATGVNSPAAAAKQQAALLRAQQQIQAAYQKGALTTAKYQQAMARLQAQMGKTATATTNVGKSAMSIGARLKAAEESVDSLWRAAFRLQMLGSKFTQWGKEIFSAFKNVMDVFSEFDYNIRRAAGALGLFQSDSTFLGVGNGAKVVSDRLDALSTAAIGVAREIKFIPAEEIAKGFYYWGSMTGFVVNNMSDLNELVAGHTAVLKAAAMTEVDFETALKGVYSVITQFFAGDISHTTDVTEKLFYVAQKTAVEFDDLIQSFKMVGPVAASLGVDFESVLTVLGDLGDLGMRGSMAGRALRQIFIQLVKPSAQAKKALEGAFLAFKTGSTGLSDTAKSVLSDIGTSTDNTLTRIQNAGTYYDAVFPKGQYAGIQNQIGVLAAMTMGMTEKTRAALLATMSTANSLPVLMALVGREIRTLQTGISASTKLNLKDSHDYFEANWKYLSQSWKGVVAAVSRAWEGLKIVIGGGIAEWAKPILDTLTGIVNSVTDWANANPRVVASLSKFAAFAGVLALITGGLLTVAGTLISFGAAIGYFSKFLALGKDVNQVLINIGMSAQGATKFVMAVGEGLSGSAKEVEDTIRGASSMLQALGMKADDAAKFIGNIGEEAGQTAKGFGAIAREGLGTFVGILSVMIALLEAVQRNIDYIRVRWDAAVKILTSGKVKDAFGGISDVIVSIQDGINTVFDLIVRRVGDAIIVVAQLVGFFEDLVKSVGGLLASVGIINQATDAVDLLFKAIGMLIAAKMITGVLGIFGVFQSNTTYIMAAKTAIDGFRTSLAASKAAGAGLSTIPGILNAVKAAFMAAGTAARGFMIATGVGALIVGLSLLIDWIGQTHKSLDDLKAESDASASAFGDQAKAAEDMARRVAAANYAAAKSAAQAAAQAAATTAANDPTTFMGPKPDDMSQSMYDGFAQINNTQNQIYANNVNQQAQAAMDQFAGITDEAYNTILEGNVKSIIDGWKGYVGKLNAILIQADPNAAPIELDRFMTAMTDLPSVAKTINTTNADLMKSVAGFIAAIPVNASMDQIKSAYDQLAQNFGSNLGITYQDFVNTFFDAGARAAAELTVQQSRWTPVVSAIIDKVIPEQGATIGDWQNVLNTKVGFFGENIKDLIASGLVDDKNLKLITNGVFGAADELADTIANTDFATTDIDKLSTAVGALTTRFISSAFEGALPGVQESLSNLEVLTRGGVDSIDVNAVFANMFESQIAGLDEGTMADAILAGSDIPEKLKKAYLDSAQMLADAGSVDAKDFLKAVKVSGAADNSAEMAKAFTSFMSDSLKSFVDAVSGGIKDSWKTTKDDLKKLLKPKNSDANSIAQLIKEAADGTLMKAMSSTTNTAARQTAYDWVTNSFIQPTIGGIQAAIDSGNTKQARQEMEGFIKDATSFPPAYWSTLDPTVAQGILTWLNTQTTGLQVPAYITDALSTVIQNATQDGVDGTEPVEVNPADLIKFTPNAQATKNIKGMGENAGASAANPLAAQVAKWSAAVTDMPPAVVPTPTVPTIPPLTGPDTTTSVNTISGFVTWAHTAITTMSLQVPPPLAPNITPATNRVTDMTTFVSGALKALIGPAGTWGTDLVQAYASHITSSAHFASAAARGVANKIAAQLHFSRPDEGPLRNLHIWGQHLVEEYAKAMRSKSGKVRAAAQNIAKTITDELKKANKAVNGIGDPINLGKHHKKNKHNNDKVVKDLNKTAKMIITSVKGAHLYKNYDDYLSYLGKVHTQLRHVNKKINKDHETHHRNRQRAHRDLIIDKNNTDASVTYTSKKKQIIEIHLIAESPDGTVHRVELGALRKGVMDALALADIEHMAEVQ